MPNCAIDSTRSARKEKTGGAVSEICYCFLLFIRTSGHPEKRGLLFCLIRSADLIIGARPYILPHPVERAAILEYGP